MKEFGTKREEKLAVQFHAVHLRTLGLFPELQVSKRSKKLPKVKIFFVRQ